MRNFDKDEMCSFDIHVLENEISRDELKWVFFLKKFYDRKSLLLIGCRNFIQ